MFILDNGGFADAPSVRREIGQLRSLADDLSALLDGQLPAPHVLARSPRIDRWALCGKRFPILSGIAIDHPEATQRIDIWQTTRIAVAAENLGWVRCADRFYRLGQIEDGQHFPWNEPSLHMHEWK